MEVEFSYSSIVSETVLALVRGHDVLLPVCVYMKFNVTACISGNGKVNMTSYYNSCFRHFAGVGHSIYVLLFS